MAAPTPDQIALVSKFEPILFFAPGERFFPSDAKRYIEKCKLWHAVDPTMAFASASTWNSGPAIAEGKIAVSQSEAGHGDVFLGKKLPSGAFEFLDPPPGEEMFLSLFDWRPSDPELPHDTRYANIEAIAAAYAQGGLNASQFWYHAEFFDTDRLLELFRQLVASGGRDFSDLLKAHGSLAAILTNPALICYYLFFPAHEEGLQGCSDAFAQHFGDYGGDWGCVSILLDRATATDDYVPRFVGLTDRNIGLVKQPDGSEARVGMHIKRWQDVPTSDAANHPSLSVAKGTHGIYAHGEIPGVVKAFTADDLARSSCGQAEAILDAPPAPSSGGSGGGLDPLGALGVMFLKALAGSSFGFFLSPLLPVVGFVAGALWGTTEDLPWGPPFGAAPDAPTPPSPVTDTLPMPGDAGKVVHPADVTVAGVTPANAVSWPTAPVTIGTRTYDRFVDRDATVLWPDDPAFAGFKGRWGPRVENDTFLRRSGMLFPSFWRMFFDALVQSDPEGTPPPHQTLQQALPQSLGTPIGNAVEHAGLAGGYDGLVTKIWVESPTGADFGGVWIGKRFDTPFLISGIEIWLSSDLGYWGNKGQTRTCTVFGRNGSDPTSPTDGDVLFTFTLADTAGLHVQLLNGFNKSEMHDRVWVTLEDPKADGVSVFTQVVWYADL